MSARHPPVLFAKVLVLAVWSIGPLAWLYFLCATVLQNRGRAAYIARVLFGNSALGSARMAQFRGLFRSRALYLVSLTEVLFSLYYRYLNSTVQRPTPYPRSRERITQALSVAVAEGLAEEGAPVDDMLDCSRVPHRLPVFRKPLAADDARAVEFRSDMSRWFRGREPDEVTLVEAREWAAWALYETAYDALPALRPDDGMRPREFVDEAVALFEQRRGMPFVKTAHGDASVCAAPIMITMEPVQARFRPLGSYLAVHAVNALLMRLWQRQHGMRRLRAGDVEYLLVEPPGWSVDAAVRKEAPPPLVFLHGLGIGLAEYVVTIRALLDPQRSPNPRPLLVPLQPWIGTGLFSRRFLKPWGPDEAASTVRRMCEQHGYDRCGVSVLSHSMGTIVHTWLLTRVPDLLQRSVLVDPVGVQLWMPHLTYRFLYKEAGSFIEYVLRYFVAHELGNANMCRRHVNWSDCAVLPADIPRDPRHIRFYLAAEDTVFDAPAVQRSLARNGLRDATEFHKGLHHGELIMAPSAVFDRIVRDLDEPVL
ncbi:hypothetical protein MSPP1_000615 [Malassezia sp. CBS 17886]|nr:hypothetical protein MSPP1_000615 [Malassezia sp. CBS 17886]